MPPARMGWHELWPVRPRVVVPPAQTKQPRWPVALWKVFAGQGVHRRLPSLLLKYPLGHGCGCLVAIVAHWKPMGQRLHVFALETLANKPGLHAMQVELPGSE